MALRAGRVGVALDQVDRNGKIIGGGGTEGVTDVKVDGISVVEDGVAEIILPIITTGDVVLEETTADDADVCVFTGGGDNSVPVSVYGATGVDIGETNYTILTQGTPSTNNVRLQSRTIILVSGGRGSASGDYRSFYATVENGTTMTVRTSAGAVVSNGIIFSISAVNSAGNLEIGSLKRNKNTAETLKFYKIREV